MALPAMGEERAANKTFVKRVREIYLNDVRDKKALSMTRTFLIAWLTAIRLDQQVTILNLEQMVRERAELEWGANTRVEFDSEKQSAVVKNLPKGLRYEWSLEKEEILK